MNMFASFNWVTRRGEDAKSCLNFLRVFASSRDHFCKARKAGIAGIFCVVAVLLPCVTRGESSVFDSQATDQFRRPVAIVALNEQLLVANRRSGSIAVVDPIRGNVVAENVIGARLSDLISLPQGDLFLALDEAAGQAIRFRLDGSIPRILDRAEVGTSPVTARLWPDHRTCSITLLWAHQLAIVDCSRELKVVRTLDLPFAPRKRRCAQTLYRVAHFGSGRSRR